MNEPKTLLQMAGLEPRPAPWNQSLLILIDCQNEYLTGALPLVGVEAALDQCALLLDQARQADAPIIHVHHVGRVGGPFDPEAERGAICDTVDPSAGETRVAKTLPNAFADTDLQTVLEESGRKNLVVGGFMTHLCISATVRTTLDHGYTTTLVGAACATRDLPDGAGGVVKAADLHRAELAALSDRFCGVVADAASLARQASR